MPSYRCNACGTPLEAKFPPFACPTCKAKGKGFAEASGTSAASTKSAVPISETPTIRREPIIAATATATAAVVAMPLPVVPASIPTNPPPPPPLPTAAPPVLREATAPPPPPEPVRRTADRVAWSFAPQVSSDRRPQPLRGCPAVDSAGRMFVAVQNLLLMFEPGATTPAWMYATAGVIPRSPVVGPDGLVRVHSTDGHLHFVDVAGRAALSPIAVGEALGSASPLVDLFNNTWVCRFDGGLIRVDASGQTTSRPFFRTRRRFDCTGLILGNTLYVGCEDHFLYAVPLAADVGDNAWATMPDRGRTGCAINGSVALGRGPTLLVAGHDDALHTFALDGVQRGSTPLPGQVLGSPVVDENGTIYLGLAQNPRNQSPRGMLVAVDPGSHQIKWRYDAPAPIESTPVIGDDGTLYFGDNDGTIHAVDSHGRLVWKTTLAAAVRSGGAIPAPGLLAFGLDDGSLVVLRCSSQSLRIGGWPKLLGTAAQSGLAAEA